MTPQQVWEHLAAARYGLIDLQEFEQWTYDSPELEAALGSEEYLALISFPFRQPDVQHELSRWLDGLYERARPTKLRRDFGAWLAQAFLDGKVDLVTTSRMFARLWNAKERWVPSEFAYIDSELDSIPMPAQYGNWDPAALSARLAEAQPLLDSYGRAARESAREILAALESDAQAI